eukprot:CAMPEP_0180201092 /NCGR_PEP_ID=MMETSP0987-20121128/6568_1 /TAXON_ID=697907 /ORGANISM="non described non described, Strain CCMP2293" /LENGTH=419 /DNA_ID=CAMNT_0022156241 /DNA_START=173 /DNA_END=1429 /DNA_ORIENTATION=-
MFSPEMMQVAQESMDKLSPEQLEAIQAQMENMDPATMQAQMQAGAERLNSLSPEQMHTQMAKAAANMQQLTTLPPDELARQAWTVTAQLRAAQYEEDSEDGEEEEEEEEEDDESIAERLDAPRRGYGDLLWNTLAWPLRFMLGCFLVLVAIAWEWAWARTSVWGVAGVFAIVAIWGHVAWIPAIVFMLVSPTIWDWISHPLSIAFDWAWERAWGVAAVAAMAVFGPVVWSLASRGMWLLMSDLRGLSTGEVPLEYVIACVVIPVAWFFFKSWFWPKQAASVSKAERKAALRESSAGTKRVGKGGPERANGSKHEGAPASAKGTPPEERAPTEGAPASPGGAPAAKWSWWSKRVSDSPPPEEALVPEDGAQNLIAEPEDASLPQSGQELKVDRSAKARKPRNKKKGPQEQDPPPEEAGGW